MANMNFGVNILPKANNTYTLGNSDYKWNIFANTLNGVSLTNIITDVQINGTSILSNNIANIPLASWNTLGVVKASVDYGLGVLTGGNAGIIATMKAETSLIKAGTNIYKPIVPYNQHEAVFYGLAKAAGDSTQSASSNTVGTYTDGAKTAIQNMLAVAPTANPIFTGSISLGRTTNSTVGHNSVALGYDNSATGNLSLAVGMSNYANANASIAIGGLNQAMGAISFAGGYHTRAYGAFSYTFGLNTTNDIPSYTEWTASTSYAVGDNVVNPEDNLMYKCTEANSDATFDYNKWSPIVKSTFIEKIGNGELNISTGEFGTPSNARALDWQGNEYLNGDLYINCNSDSTGGTKVATLSDIPSTMVGATSSVAGTSGLVPAPATTDVDKFLAGDGTYKSGGLPMVILSYGNSTWQDFINAYNNNVIVYCRASSNSNPATGNQLRMAFMAYIGGSATTPTEVEFQYYRSVNSHSATQMSDQVYIYKLTNKGVWSVTVREAGIKQVLPGTGTAVSYSNNAVTIGLNQPVWEVINEEGFTNDTEADYTITTDSNGDPFELTDIRMIFELPKLSTDDVASSKGAYGQIWFYFGTNDYLIAEPGAFSRAVGEAAKGCWYFIEYKDNMVTTTFSIATTSSNANNIRVRFNSTTGGANADNNMGMKVISNFKINKIVIRSVTGNGRYKLYGKRKAT